MHFQSSLVTRDDCSKLASCPPVSCPGNCNLKTQSCSIVAQSCPATCTSIRCDPLPGQSSGRSGPSPGALAGAVIGALLFLGLVVLGYFYYRRREAAREAAAREKANGDVKPDIPARADTVLSRPDPHFSAHAVGLGSNEKLPNRSGSATELGTVRVYNNQSNTTINLDPSHVTRRHSTTQSSRSNPFADGVSIQTASDRTQSTNVIPIALVPPGGHPPDTLSHSHAGPPARPERSPELTLNDTNHLDLDHVMVSDSEFGGPRLPHASSTRSGVSGKSYMTTSSTATDLDESPTIMTPKQGVVRQVFGISQAQVVRVPSNAGSLPNSPSSPLIKPRGGRITPNTRNAAARVSKGTIGRSPLAQQSFTPADIPLSNREPISPTSTAVSRANPFSDSASPNRASFADSSRSTDTFGSPTDYHTEGPFTPRPGVTFADVQSSRPVSTASTADGVSIRADIGTASRVILGMQSPAAYTPSVLSPGIGPSRGTSMQTNGGTVTSVDRDDDEESVRPHSILSAKTTSSHADSVLAGFPFVPPSPISALPPRSPGATSPNSSPSSAGSMFARQQALSNPSTSPSLSPTSTIVTQTTLKSHQPKHLPPPVPRPNYNGLAAERAASTFSTSTTSGLETYPFQFDNQSAATPIIQLRQSGRASLDTLALSRVLEAFPLEHESTNFEDQKHSK